MQDLRPTVWIGKSGCTESMIDEIRAQLKKRKVVKVKWLQNTDIDPEAIAARTKSDHLEVRGRTHRERAVRHPAGAGRNPGYAGVRHCRG